MYRVLSSLTKSTTLALTDTGSQKFSKWNRALKGSSNFDNARVYLFVSTLVNPKSFQTPHGMYRVVSYLTKSMTLALTDTDSQKFSKWNRAPKGSSNFNNARAYLFVKTLIAIMYRVVSSLTKSTTLALTGISSQKFSKWNQAPKGSSNFNNARVYLFVKTLIAIMYRVMSSLTESTTLALTDIDSQKFFKMESSAERLVKFW
jgi:hypothetical protein